VQAKAGQRRNHGRQKHGQLDAETNRGKTRQRKRVTPPPADLNHDEKANLLKMKSNRQTVRGSGRKKGDDEQAQVQHPEEKEP